MGAMHTAVPENEDLYIPLHIYTIFSLLKRKLLLALTRQFLHFIHVHYCHTLPASHFIYFLFCRVADSQSKPSYRPSPVVAQQACMYHCLWRRPCRPSLSVISAALMALGKSCLLANTRRIDSRNSSSFNMRCNSSLAIS